MRSCRSARRLPRHGAHADASNDAELHAATGLNVIARWGVKRRTFSNQSARGRESGAAAPADCGGGLHSPRPRRTRPLAGLVDRPLRKSRIAGLLTWIAVRTRIEIARARAEGVRGESPLRLGFKGREPSAARGRQPLCGLAFPTPAARPPRRAVALWRKRSRSLLTGAGSAPWTLLNVSRPRSGRLVLRAKELLLLRVCRHRAEVDHFAGFFTDDPGVVSRIDAGRVARSDFALGPVVHHDLHSA